MILWEKSDCSPDWTELLSILADLAKLTEKCSKNCGLLPKSTKIKEWYAEMINQATGWRQANFQPNAMERGYVARMHSVWHIVSSNCTYTIVNIRLYIHFVKHL